MIDPLTTLSPEPNVETDNTHRKNEKPNTTVSSFVIGEDEVPRLASEQQVLIKAP